MSIFSADTANFLRKLTPRKVWNGLKITSSYFLTRWLSRPIQWGLPFNVSVEPTTSCNLGCPECPSGTRSFTRPTGRLQMEQLQQWVDELSPQLIFMYFYFQGEPFLHPQFSQLVNYASQKGIYTVTSTNAHFLNDKNCRNIIEAGLDRMIISIDGTTQETYESYRKGGSLDRVLEGAQNMVKWKQELNASNPHLIFQFLVVGPNEHQIDELFQLARETGVDDVKLKTAQIYDYENGHPLIPEQDKFSRYKKMPDGTFKIKNKLANHCWKLWHSCVITWDGKVVPCCFDKDAKHQLGDLTQSSFQEIWWSKSYHAFRQKLTRSRKEIDICQNCTEGTKVWIEPG